MFRIALCIAIFGYLSVAVPLESPSSDLGQFFDTRIVGGSEATPGSFLHMVALVVGWQYTSFVCGGAIITKSVVLTAAHCIVALVDWNGVLLGSSHGIVGTHNWKNDGVVIQFKAYKNNPYYDHRTIKNDSGLLITEQFIQFGLKVQPIKLDCGWIGANEKSYVAGWGTQRLYGEVPDELQMLPVETISSKECLRMIAVFAELWGFAPPMDAQLEICTYHSPGHGMCHGDSGSPLISEKTRKLLGIVSWGFPCAIGGPDMFVRGSSQLGFIFGFTGNLCGNH